MIAAIQEDAIPELYLEDLGSVAHELVAQIPRCEQPPPPPDEDDDEGEGKKKKDKKNKHEDDD